MPRSLTGIKQLIELSKREDATVLTYKPCQSGQVKLKVRTGRYLYTLTIKDAAKAKKVLGSVKRNFQKTIRL
jgi:hypothetical protein